MNHTEDLKRIAAPLKDTIQILKGPKIIIVDPNGLGERIEGLVRTAVLGEDPDRNLARWLIRTCAVESGAIPASTHDLYLARGRGETRDDFTVPAINLRAISFYAARAVFRTAHQADAHAIIFEIARSEIGYTDQRPSEFAACILGAAIAEGHKGPVFLQGDHFQVSASRYAESAQSEIDAVLNLCQEAINAGFYNIDIDTSTLVDLNQPSIPEQQETNYTLCAELAGFVRSHEPGGITISIGGEIGEVGGKNSTEPELRAFMEGFNQKLPEFHSSATGLSKISIQTGTSHGGVVLPDGSIASVNLDFDTLEHLGVVAKDYGMGGAVQHGASTLPEEAFSNFVEAGTLEVHLATNFQNILYDYIDEELQNEIHSFLRENHIDERKPDQTDEQFYYKTRKRAIGPFKKQLWDLPVETRDKIEKAWEDQFRLLFDRLNVGGTQSEVEQTIKTIPVYPPITDYFTERRVDEDVSDLAD